MKIRYYYNNGDVIDHTKFVSKKTIEKEKGDATRVNVYKVHTVYQTEENEEFVETLILD